MSAATFFPIEERPSFIAPIYPVVTMDEECVHKRSRRALLGDSKINDKNLRDSLSIEKHIPIDCPPVFIINCKDDPIVDYHNSELLDSALMAKNIPHKYIQYKTGGHGFGASETKGSSESRQWKKEFIKWLNNNIK
jgi:acetyl esterase/lipase